MAMMQIKDGHSWGIWTIRKSSLSLDLTSRQHSYQIRLDEINDSAAMLDWIFQLLMKSWFTDQMLGDLLRAFEDIYHPQATLCGQGIGKTINALALLKKKIV